MGQPVHRDDEEYYLQLLEEGRKTEQRLYGERRQYHKTSTLIGFVRQLKKCQMRANVWCVEIWTIL